MNSAVAQLKAEPFIIPELKLIDLEQGSDAWLTWRDTVIGASDGWRAMGMSRALYDVYTDAKERSKFAGNKATDTGHEREAAVRWDYEIDNDVTLSQWCGQRGFIAASSDGAWLSDRPKPRYGIEVKSPSDEAIHEKYIGGTIGDIGDTHYHQCQQNIYVFDFDYIDFISYKPDATGNNPTKYILRVWPNTEYIENMVQTLTIFWNRVQTKQWPDAEKTSLELAKSIAGPSAPAMVASGVPFALSERVGDLVASAAVMSVDTQQSAEDATDLIKNMRLINKKLSDTRLDITKPHRDYCTDVKAKFDSVTNELDSASKALTSKLHTFNQEQERLRQIEIARQQEEMRKQQEEEQRKLRIAQAAREAEERKAREAEQQRLQAEADASRAVEEARLAKEREELAKTNAAAAEEQAKEHARLAAIRAEQDKADEAERLRLAEQDLIDAAARNETERLRLEQQAADDAARLEQQSQKKGKTRGMASTASARTTMQFEVVDLSLVPLEYMMLDESKVRTAIRRKDKPVSEIEGLKIFGQQSTVVR